MLILASASQSRKKLLENCQIEFIQISSDFDETTIQEKNIFNLALELSFQKANNLENARIGVVGSIPPHIESMILKSFLK